MTQPDDNIPYGFCHCGCGNETPRAPQTIKRLGLAKGEPYRFLAGHQWRRPNVPDYVEEDRGFGTPCWIWQRAFDGTGYGRACHDGRMFQAHRFIYERLVGPIPEGMQLDHLCRVRSCVNPSHLEPVTNATNTRRGERTKLSREDVALIHELGKSESTYAIAAKLNISPSHVWRILNGQKWSAN